MLMSYANKVVIVPGYGLAVAQAQHVCHELEKVKTETKAADGTTTKMKIKKHRKADKSIVKS